MISKEKWEEIEHDRYVMKMTYRELIDLHGVCSHSLSQHFKGQRAVKYYCALCSRRISNRKAGQIYCSYKCRHKSYRMRRKHKRELQ